MQPGTEFGPDAFLFALRLSLTGVIMLLENPEILNVFTGDSAHPKRRTGMIKESILLILLAWAIALASTLFWDFGGLFESVAKVASLMFFILGLVGLLRFLFAFLFVKDAVQSPLLTAPEAPHAWTLPENPNRAGLTSGHSVPVSDYSPRSNTREMISRPSVTRIRPASLKTQTSR